MLITSPGRTYTLYLFKFDPADLSLKLPCRLLQAEDEGRIYVGGSGQTARIWGVKIKFPPNKSFTFNIRYYIDDDTELSTVSDHSPMLTLAYCVYYIIGRAVT